MLQLISTVLFGTWTATRPWRRRLAVVVGRASAELGPLQAVAVAVKTFDVRKYEDELLLLFL
jgi:hypothetical protein